MISNKKGRVYFDHAATTPLSSTVMKAMADFESEYFGNPNSIHWEGQQARAKIDFARAEIAAGISAKPQELIFTSGATEANNHAIKGVVSHALSVQQIKPHVITTELEHQSVYNVIKDLEKQGIVEATFLKPKRDGLIQADDVIKAVQENTILVSMIFASNEIGSILPVREVGKFLADLHKKDNHKVYFHTDAVQAIKYCNCHVEKIGVDLMTFSGHKINGPKGIGALYIKNGTKFDNLMLGGSQEYGKRPGTQNTAAIIGFAQAVKEWGNFEARSEAGKKIQKLSENLMAALKDYKNIEINGPLGGDRSPDNVNFTILNQDQETLIAKLDLAGFAVSTGSACVSGSTEPSHVIAALGKISTEEAAVVRVSFGPQNTISEVNTFVETMTSLINP